MEEILKQNLANLLAPRGVKHRLSIELDINCSTVSRWATGRCMPTLENLEMIANHFAIDPIDLFKKLAS